MPRHVQQLFPVELKKTSSDELRWVFTIFSLCWERFPGSQLPESPQLVWDKTSTIPLEDLPAWPKHFPESTAFCDVPDPPEHWYSEIDDIVSASRQALDILLTTWDSVPPGWVGCLAPSNLRELQAYLIHSLRTIEMRGAAFPQFQDATTETTFNGVHSRRWWPYVEYLHEQLETARKASRNVDCWLKHHGAPYNRPPGISGTDNINVTVEELTALLRFVAGTDLEPVDRQIAPEDAGKTDDQKAVKQPKDEKPKPRPFDGGMTVFFQDRVELCGVDICSGPRSETSRRLLEAHARIQSDGKLPALSGTLLAEAAKIESGPDAVAGVIGRLRDRISQVLLAERNIVCGPDDVILSGGPGYRLNPNLSVQFAETSGGDADQYHRALPDGTNDTDRDTDDNDDGDTNEPDPDRRDTDEPDAVVDASADAVTRQAGVVLELQQSAQ